MKSYKKYKFRKYDKKYPQLFKREKIKLKRILGNNAVIEHIGSTAVPGLGGKGVIDILIAVLKKDINKIRGKLEKAKYLLSKSGGGIDRLFFTIDYRYGGNVRRVHIQLTLLNSHVHKEYIRFRDRLISDKKYFKKYADINKKGGKAAKNKGRFYRKYKEKFIKSLLQS